MIDYIEDDIEVNLSIPQEDVVEKFRRLIKHELQSCTVNREYETIFRTGRIVMTREEARKAAEIMLAYAEGKTVESYKRGHSVWIELDEEPSFNWKEYDYRIKKEPTYRPFKNKEECWNEIQKHQPFGWIYEILSAAYININSIDRMCVCCDEDTYEYREAFKKFKFADGTPFGIKED